MPEQWEISLVKYFPNLISFLKDYDNQEIIALHLSWNNSLRLTDFWHENTDKNFKRREKYSNMEK